MASFRSTSRMASSARPPLSPSLSATARQASNFEMDSSSSHLQLRPSSVWRVQNNIYLEPSTLHGQGRGDDAMLAPNGPVWALSISTPPSKAEIKGTLHNSARLHNSAAAFQPVISDSGVPAAFFQSEIVRRSGISCYGVSKICEYQTRTRKRTTSATTPLRINSMRDPLSMSKIASVGGCPMH